MINQDPEPEVNADLEKEAANVAPTNDELQKKSIA
mgnify:FL=1|jgi:hypothetical protein